MPAQPMREVTVEGLVFSAPPDVVAALRAGELDPDVAYMQGRLKVAGDMVRFFDLLPLASCAPLREAFAS